MTETTTDKRPAAVASAPAAELVEEPVAPSLEPAAVPISGLATLTWPADELLGLWASWVPALLSLPLPDALATPGTGDLAQSAGPEPAGETPATESPTEAPTPAAPGALDATPAGTEQGEGAAPPERPAAASSTTGAPAAAGELSEDTPDPTGGLAAWSGRVRAAIRNRIVAPPPADPERVAAPVTAGVDGVRRREQARRAGALPGVKRAMPKPPVMPDGLPPLPALPMPQAETAVTAALGKQLPKQVLPLLQDYVYAEPFRKPVTYKAQVGLRLPEGSTSVLAPVPPPPAPGREGRAKLAKVKKAGADVVPVPAVAGAFTLDVASAGTGPATPTLAPPGPPVTRADVAGVLVRLRADVPDDAHTMLMGVRSGMYPRAMLQVELPSLGATLQADVEARVGAGVDAIASRYRIDLDVLHGATLDEYGKIQGALAQQVAAVDKAATQAKKEAAKQSAESAGTIEGAKAGADEAVDAKLLEASGGASPAAIRAQRDRLIGRVNRRLAPEDLRYEKEGEDRVRALQLMEVAYTGAYQHVAQDVAARIRKDSIPSPVLDPASLPAPALGPKGGLMTPTDTRPAPSNAPPTPAETWTLARLGEVGRDFGALRKAAQDATKSNRAGIESARSYATLLLIRWADEQIGDRQTAWDGFWDWVLTWAKAADDKTLAWEEARMANLAVDLQGDLTFVGGLTSGAHDQQELEALSGVGALSTAQQAIVKAYFAKPKGERNPLDAVAAGMRVRVAEALRGRLVEELNQRLYDLPKFMWAEVAAVAEAEGGNVSIVERGNKFWAAVDQWGTDEAAVYASLTGLTKLQRHALDLWYQEKHGWTIKEELEDELSKAELDRAQDLWSGDQLAADAAAIKAAIQGPGTDEQEIYRALRNKSPEERSQLEAIYESRYHITLEKDLASDMSGEELARAEALRHGNVREADAIGLERAKSGKWYGGADTDEIQSIYAVNRTEVEDEGRRLDWTADEVKANVFKRHGEIDKAHREHYRKDALNEGAGLEASFRNGLSGPALDLALGLHQQDWPRADAARLELERRSFITKDKVVNQILESQYSRAEKEVRFDQEHQLAVHRDLASIRGERWDDKAQRAAMDKTVETVAKDRAKGYMTALQSTYDAAYKGDPIYALDKRGGFDNLIADHLMGSDKDRAKALVAGGGYLTAAQEIQFAVQGPGTDVDVIKRVLANKSPKQVKEISDQWDKDHKDGPSLRDRVMDEVSGREAFDVGLLLEGEPQTPDDKLNLARRKRDYEASAYALGNSFSTDEQSDLDDEVDRLQRTVDRLQHAPPGSVEAQALTWLVDQNVRAVDSAVEEHRRAVDSLTDKLAMAAALVAGLVVTAVTFGAAGPVVAGVLGALAATEATMITKLAFKGSAYSNEELLVDVVSGAVDIAFALLPGVGPALRKVAEKLVAGPLVKLATSGSRIKRMLAHGIGNSVEGFLSGIPSAAAGSLADEKTWTQGDPLTNFVTATGMGAGTGALMSGAMGSFHGWKAPTAVPGPHGRIEVTDANRAFEGAEGPASRVDHEARAGQWNAHQAENPNASYADFLDDLQSGRILPDPDAGAGFHRVAREQLGAGLPAADRRLVEGVPVKVLGDAEFGRFTDSESAHAVTIVENGRPVVILREGAPMAALREEGIHVAQLLDPKYAAQAGLLDEAQMARWSSLDLRTKMAMYAAKLDLEVDAQRRLVLGLAEQLDQMPPGLAREAVADQLGAAQRNFGILGQRRVELASFGPLDRLAARFGRGRLAARLEQPPRLFSKGTLGRVGWKAGPTAPLHVDEQRQLVRNLRAEIAGLEARAAKRGRLSTNEVENLEGLRSRLREQYAAAAPGTERAQEAALFDRLPGESLNDYHQRLGGLGDEVLAHAAYKENAALLDRYSALLKQTASDVEDLKGLRSALDEARTKGRENAHEALANAEARRNPDPAKINDLVSARDRIAADAVGIAKSVAKFRDRIDAFAKPRSLYFADEPWRLVSLVDPANPRITGVIGAVGELDTSSKMIADGFEPLGGTVDPRAVRTMEKFDQTVKARSGQQDIDGIFKGTNGEVKEYVLSDSKGTADVSPKEPTGSGRLKTMTSDADVSQLSDPWLGDHLPDAGLEAGDLHNIQQALKQAREMVAAGKKLPADAVFEVVHPDGSVEKVRVRKVYGQTFRDAQGNTHTRRYHVIGDPPRITGEFSK